MVDPIEQTVLFAGEQIIQLPMWGPCTRNG